MILRTVQLNQLRLTLILKAQVYKVAEYDLGIKWHCRHMLQK